MKFKGLIFILCFLFTGALMADPTPGDDAATPAPAPAPVKPHPHHRKRKKKIHAKAPVATDTAQAPAAAVAAPAAAVAVKQEVPKVDTFQAWLEGIKKHLAQSDTRSNKLVAVAAVRGDETSDAPPLYWKGKKAEVRDDVPERKDFEAAIDIAMKGDKVGAKERLQSFLLAYPKSAYAPDAQETLKRLENN